VRESGEIERLPAMEPPLGMSTEHPSVDSRAWSPETDLLVLFTDGVSDARDRSDRRLGEQRVLDTIRAHRAQEPEEILERVIEMLDQHRGEVPPRDDLTLVVFKS
jgi:sigma-B regulation protein RsbU (phosphoserine phosphatase)